MPQHFDQRVLPYAPEKVFDLVADIERYPEFLPWCKGARVCSRKGNEITAELVVGYKVFRDTFTSVVTLDRPSRISVSYGGGPLAHLSNEWRFAPKDGGCELTFYLDFGFRSQLLGGMINLFFDKAFRKMAVAFEARAGELYG
jgi:coenzyme Q-binding protein COQ10